MIKFSKKNIRKKNDQNIPFYDAKGGLNIKTVREISWKKKEPFWMKKFREQAYLLFEKIEMPKFGPSLSNLNLQNIKYYSKPTEKISKSWDDVPEKMKNTFEKLGIPEAERKYLAGVETQYDSEMIYGSLKKYLSSKGVIFVDSDTALSKYQDLFKQYFASVIPPSDNKFSALNSAFWSGGSFIYVPKGVKVELPLQAYFMINSENLGQFERTLIIADEGSFVHYIEGCSAPTYSSNLLHAGVVEIIVKKQARVRYTTIQNWSKNVYNLVTKRAFVYDEGIMEWIDGNIGSKITMKYPSVYLLGKKAKANILSIAFSGKDQNQDCGGKIFHSASETSSLINSRSICKDGGISTYRGMVTMSPQADNSLSKIACNSLILDDKSQSSSYPMIKADNSTSSITHEAIISRIEEEQLFYLQSRGIDKTEAINLIVNGFIEPIVKEIPLEYAVELNRLTKLDWSS